MDYPDHWLETKADYDRNGFVFIADILSKKNSERLLVEVLELGRGNRVALFGTAQLPDNLDDLVVLSRYLNIQFSHKISALVHYDLFTHPAIAKVLSLLIGPSVRCMQSMLFIKSSGKPSQAWHQDKHFIPTPDCSLAGVWLASDDSTRENGCLWVRPGIHTDDVIYYTSPHVSTNFESGNQLIGTRDDADMGTPIQVKGGAAIIFNGYLRQRILSNRAMQGPFCRASVNHCMSANLMSPWDWDGRIPPTRDVRDIAMICGNDPQSPKGVDDITYAFLCAATAELYYPNHDATKKIF